MAFDIEILKKYPENPGVYLMKNRAGKVIYVGKAKNLRQRIRQYFVKAGDGREMVPFLVAQVESIDTLIVTSEKEALLVENNLIKKYKPKYNALLKDDKTYIALKVTKHTWPRVDIVRYRGKPKPDGIYFGPYTGAWSARRTLDLLHKLFPMRQCSDAEFARRTRPCILYDMKRCIAPCVGLCTKEDYDTLVNRTVRFLRGQDKEIVADLYEEMRRYSDKLEFEKAGDVMQTIRHIEKTVEQQKVEKPLGGDADVLGIFREAEEVVLVLLFFRSGRLTGSRHFNFSNIAQDDSELLQTFLLQHYDKMEELPHEILLPAPVPQAQTIAELLGQDKPRKILIHTPQKGDKKALVEMARVNAEATFRKEKDEDNIREQMLLALQEKLLLNRYPKRIECFDVSNIAGREAVATRVAFTEGKKDAARYRKYKIRSQTELPDDYAAIFEVLIRRLSRGKEENDLPDLLVIDGGKGHLNAALRVLHELNIITVDVISIAKESGRHDKGMTAEQIFLPNIKDPIRLNPTSPILFLLQKIRDEAHRTAIAFHRGRRSKALTTSSLEEIEGIGPAKKKALLKHFGSLKAIKGASIEDLQKAVSHKDARAIFGHFHR